MKLLQLRGTLMKKIIYHNDKNFDNIFGTANLVPNHTGLSGIDIQSDHKGILHNYKHSQPRIKLSKDPKILAPKNRNHQDLYRIFKEGIEYVARNWDVFLKHYNDTDENLFDDEDLFNALRVRGEYK